MDVPSPADCAGITLLGELPPDLLARVLARARVAAFAPGEIVLRRGLPNDALHFLLSGLVHVRFELEDRTRPIEVGAGRMFGEMSVVDGLPASANVVAAAPSRVLLVPDEVFWSEVVGYPGAALAVMRALSRMLRDNTEAVTAALREELRRESLERELALAREIQMGLLRREEPWFPGERRFAVAAAMQPAKEVGGDLYDAFMLGPDRLLLAIGDAAGKGIAAALFMTRAATLLRSAAGHWTTLEEVAGTLNDELARGNDSTMFVTLLLAVLDLGSGALEAVSFGHCDPVLRGPDGVALLRPPARAPGLGLFAGTRGVRFAAVLPPGATLLLYSDGVTEAMDAAQAEFGTQRLLDAVAAAPADPPALVRAVMDAVARHAGAAEQADDISLLALRWNGPG